MQMVIAFLCVQYKVWSQNPRQETEWPELESSDKRLGALTLHPEV